MAGSYRWMLSPAAATVLPSGAKAIRPDVLPDLGEDVQLLAGSDLKETEPPVAPGAAGECRPVGRERERSQWVG